MPMLSHEEPVLTKKIFLITKGHKVEEENKKKLDNWKKVSVKVETIL